jgi:hypothetical protein
LFSFVIGSNFRETYFMANEPKPTHTLRAWVSSEFVPTLHIAGEIPTNGEKPVVTLTEAIPQGINPKDLLLDFNPDVYDPEGSEMLPIQEFTKTLSSGSQYASVTIRAKKAGIHLTVTNG